MPIRITVEMPPRRPASATAPWDGLRFVAEQDPEEVSVDVRFGGHRVWSVVVDAEGDPGPACLA